MNQLFVKVNDVELKNNTTLRYTNTMILIILEIKKIIDLIIFNTEHIRV